MAAFEVIALDTATPQLRAPGAGDSYTFPRAVEMPLGTANGVLYLDGSKVVTSGSALTFDGTNLGIGTSSPGYKLDVASTTDVVSAIRTTGSSSSAALLLSNGDGTTSVKYSYIRYLNNATSPQEWRIGTYNTDNFIWRNHTAGTNSLTLDTSGNLGLGVTPSAHALSSFGGPIFQVSLAGLMGSASDNILAHNTYYASGAYRYIASSTAATRFDQTGGAFRWLTAPSGTAGNTISFTQVMAIPAAGGLVVGAAALATSATDGFLYVPTCAGTPTGTPTTQTGTAPIVVDTTNNKLYFYSGGSWVAAN